MAYAPPSIGPSGLIIPSYLDILGWLIGQFRGIFGSSVYLGTDSADYQDLSVRALQASDFLQSLQAVYLGFNPQTAIGADLDLVGRLIGTARNTSSQSIASVTIAGAIGTTITKGVIQDANGNYWDLSTPIVIGSSGTVFAIATAQKMGAITANPGELTRISTPTAGWTSVTNPAAAIPGRAVESDAQYRARLLVAQSKPSISLVAGTAAAIAAVNGVTRSHVYENPTGGPDGNSIPAHSITCVVEGGAAADIAAAIYSNRGIGCGTNGTTAVTVTDPANGLLATVINFDVLGYVPVYVSLNVHALEGFTTPVQAAIAAGVVDYLNSLGIGEAVVFSELYGAALRARPDPDQPLFSVRAVLSGAQAASTTGTLTIGSATVSVTSSMGIVNGQTVVGPGIPDNTTITISGTTVTLSHNATENGLVDLEFFTTGTSDIAISFVKAAQGSPAFVVVNLV